MAATTAARRPRAHRRTRAGRGYGPANLPLSPALVPLVLVVAWQLATFVLSERILPTPASTLAAFADGMAEGWLSANLWITLQVVLVAFVVAAGLGLLVGASLGLQRFWGDVLGAPLVWTYALPKITIFPVFLLIFGLGDNARIAFGAFHGFFPLAIILLSGVRAIPEVYLRTARSFNLSWWATVRQVVLPATLPSVLAGLRFCFSLTFLGVVLAEMFGASEGAGYELVRRITLQDMPELFALAFSLMAIPLLLNLLMLAFERRMAPPTQHPTRAGDA